MVNRLLQPQEVEVFYILPALRRELALALKATGISQKEIAGRLGVTEPAISQYLSSKRASLVKFNDNITTAIKESAERIKDEVTLMREMQRLLRLSHESKVVCQVHESLGQVPKGCQACFEK